MTIMSEVLMNCRAHNTTKKNTGVIFNNGDMVWSVFRDFDNPCRRNLYHFVFTKFTSKTIFSN